MVDLNDHYLSIIMISLSVVINQSIKSLLNSECWHVTSGASYLYFPQQRFPLVLLLGNGIQLPGDLLYTPDVITNQEWGHNLDEGNEGKWTLIFYFSYIIFHPLAPPIVDQQFQENPLEFSLRPSDIGSNWLLNLLTLDASSGQLSINRQWKSKRYKMKGMG